MYYEPAEKDAPVESAWSSELYLNFVPRLFEPLRKEFGEDLPLLHDVHHRLTPIEAARLGKSLEPYHLFWLEDPVSASFRRGSASFASTQPRLLPWAKCSTQCGTRTFSSQIGRAHV